MMTKLVDCALSDRILIFGLVFASVLAFNLVGADLSNGLGDHIEWVKWSEAQEKASLENKPLMVSRC